MLQIVTFKIISVINTAIFRLFPAVRKPMVMPSELPKMLVSALYGLTVICFPSAMGDLLLPEVIHVYNW